MAERKRLGDFCTYVGQQWQAIQDVYKEIEEVQFQFNEIYRQRTAAWQAAIGKTVPMLVEAEAPPPTVAQNLLKMMDEERAKLENEIAGLVAQVKQKRGEADATAAEAQAEVATLRRDNPQLDKEEEELKAGCAATREAIRQREAEIRATGFFRFLQRRRLGRLRAEQVEAMAAQTLRLRQVRLAWADEKKRFQDDQARLHTQWEAASVEAAQLQARLDYLQENLERLSRQNGAGRYLAELAAVPEAPEPLRATLAQMVELNRIKAQYEEGLRTVAEALGLLKGLADGMERFLKSADKVHEEQRQFNLRELHVQLSDEVLAFHALWPEFRAQVKDEKTLGTHPAEFSQRVHATIQGRLADSAIANMFESMGGALTEATKAWK